MATSSKKKTVVEAVSEAGDDFVKALQPFRYGDLRLSRQQVFQLQGGRNDQNLLQLRYLVPVKKGTALFQCAECGALFDNEHWLTSHGDLWHSFTCECGWQPQPGQGEKETQLRRHLTQCEIHRAAWEKEHATHVELAKAMQED